ncbi:hypothetical protein C8R43DRAFT_980450 [Mycena crocata]|nr:hypothetical protein C8R43DRAFT_980450 [Mycena crocata]
MDDAESLFGSPPPTPTRGRSPSPALALPSVSRNIINLSSSSAQNVGTIALPGSQHFSELPVNPLALSLSYPPYQNGDVLRPPAQRRDGFLTQVRPHIPAASPAVSAPSLKRRPTKKPKAKPKASAARPAPPPIHLPDPSQSDPLPPNLLRNQPGLLGTAGVVAGVRPAHLPAPTPTQGTTSSNPIFVDDEVQPAVASRFKRAPRAEVDHIDVDPASLPPPSNQDIVSTLINQRDIFPLLENILKFIATEATPRAASEISQSQSCTSSDAGSRSQTPESSTTSMTRKRRKLRHVPAGAELWDVPFPFNEGEGPKTYRNDWEKDRGKKLIGELVTLIKGAARKAAVRNYVHNRRSPTDAELAKIGKHYRVDTLFYGPVKGSETEVLADTSNASRCAVTPSIDPSPTPSLPQVLSASGPSSSPSTPTPFDQLISSLLSASSTEQFSFDSEQSSSADGFFNSSSALDTGLFNSWMDIFQTFPVPAEGFTPDFKAEDYHIDPMQTFLTVPDSLLNPVPNIGSSTLSFDFPSDITGTFPETSAGNQNYYPTTLDDLMIDPVLFGIDTSLGGGMSNFSDSGCPSLAGSPIPSVSSSSFAPSTPVETTWNGDAGIGVYSPGDEHREGSSMPPFTGKGKQRDLGDVTWTDAEKEALSFLAVLSKAKGKGKADEDGQDDREGKEVQDEDFSKLRTLPIVGRLAKADVLNHAKQRRAELVNEIARTRTALWETTIEGGVLAGVVKYYSKT